MRRISDDVSRADACSTNLSPTLFQEVRAASTFPPTTNRSESQHIQFTYSNASIIKAQSQYAFPAPDPHFH